MKALRIWEYLVSRAEAKRGIKRQNHDVEDLIVKIDGCKIGKKSKTMEITEDLVQKKERPVGLNSVVQHPKLAESSRGNRASADSMQLHPLAAPLMDEIGPGVNLLVETGLHSGARNTASRQAKHMK